MAYRITKYVRRHRVGVGVAAILTTILVAFAAIQSVQLHRITRERDRADRIAQFMTGSSLILTRELVILSRHVKS